jgi:2'-5' RNA ligase
VWFVGAPVSFDGDLDEAFSRDEAIVPTRPGDRHLTLAYLGRLPSDDVMRVWRGLPQLALPERLRPLGWERFGRRAIALTLAGDDGRLRAAADACCHVAEAQLPKFRRPASFRAHVTLGRVRKEATPPPPARMDAWRLPPGPVSLGRPTLFRLKDDREGDRYEVVEQQPRAATSGLG